MADTVRGIWQSIVQTKRLYLNPHEQFGRANICRAALASYVGIYFLFKWNQNRKADIARAERKALKLAAPAHAIGEINAVAHHQ